MQTSLEKARVGRLEENAARRVPIGAEYFPGQGVHFRVWAPARRQVAVVCGEQSAVAFDETSLEAEEGGYFSGWVRTVKPGATYRYRLDGEAPTFPDPASRFQPVGVSGPAQVVDPAAYVWGDRDWAGVSLEGQVLYELHVGTFTAEGTWASAGRRLPLLAETGVTIVEVMPVAEFQGRFGWGYDGVDLFAPTRLYGSPDDFRQFVDLAHQHGLGVILDVVYNHFGPTGNYLGQFSADYLSHRGTDWGNAINFDGPNCQSVREFFIANAGCWIDEFHLDGLRLDAVQAIVDESADHILAAITRRAREAAGMRRIIVTAENELQQSRILRPAEVGGCGLDAAWNDDFHHAARVALTGHAEYYYADYRGTPQELISALKWGYLYQGQWNRRQQRRRGTPALDLSGPQFVNFLQNHDQVANSGRGERSHELTSPGRHRALTALLLLAPGTPLLFQGQEFAASAPFLYFADHPVDLARLVREGRAELLRQFPRLSGAEAASLFADPADPQTFARCKLEWGEREQHADALALHRDLLRLRREDPVFASQRTDRLHGVVLAAEAFVLHYEGEAGDCRLLLINLGRDLDLGPAAEPLLGPPAGQEWRLLWSSDDPRYGGCGTAPWDVERWYLPGHAMLVLASQPSG